MSSKNEAEHPRPMRLVPNGNLARFSQVKVFPSATCGCFFVYLNLTLGSFCGKKRAHYIEEGATLDHVCGIFIMYDV